MERTQIPLFPLHTVLFPGGPLALRIFEARYLDMVGRCLKENSGFGVVLIREGSEVGAGASTFDTGTYGHISYWNKLPNGMLGITLRGERRFRVHDTELRPDGLVEAEVEFVDNESKIPVPVQHTGLVDTLQEIMGQLDHPYIHLPKDYECASWVSGRLTELLPMDTVKKQQCLQMDDPLGRLDLLQEFLSSDQ